MEILLLVARLFLALTFGVAAIAKAADTTGLRRTLVEFGLPEKLASPAALLLPVAEILIALALLPLWSAWWGAAAAFALLMIFAAAIGVNLIRGNAPDCNCFGQLHSKPVSWSLFMRDVLLAAVAVVIMARGKNGVGPGAFDWAADLSTGEGMILVFGVATVGLLSTAVVYLSRAVKQQAVVLERVEAMKKVIDEDYAEPPIEREDALPPVEGLPVGAPAPSFSLDSIGGERVTLEDLLAYGKPVLLLFVSPNCGPCKTLFPLIGDWERDYDAKLTVALISKGGLKETEDEIAGYKARHLLLQGKSGIQAQYGAKWTPAAVLINAQGRIASKLNNGDEAIQKLVINSVKAADAKPKRSLPIKKNGHHPELTIGRANAFRDVGEKAHSFSLPDMNGGVVSTNDLLGRDTMLLFWDPKCPYCISIAEDLIDLEKNPPKGAPRFVFISSGDEVAVRAESRRFKSQFLYDPAFEVGILFGSNLTPSAVLIDAKGRIISAPTAGRSEILALIGAHDVVQPIAAGR